MIASFLDYRFIPLLCLLFLHTARATMMTNLFPRPETLPQPEEESIGRLDSSQSSASSMPFPETRSTSIPSTSAGSRLCLQPTTTWAPCSYPRLSNQPLHSGVPLRHWEPDSGRLEAVLHASSALVPV